MEHLQHTLKGVIERRSPRHTADADVPFASLRSALPSLGVTKFRLKQLQAINLIREERESGKQELACSARPIVLCGIPLRRPPKDQLTYTRRNGKFFLDITGHPRFGLPFSQDRLERRPDVGLSVCLRTAVITAASCRGSSASLRPRFYSAPKISRTEATSLMGALPLLRPHAARSFRQRPTS